MKRTEGSSLAEPVAVRLTESALDDVQRVQARLQDETPYARVTQADALRYLILAGSERVTV